MAPASPGLAVLALACLVMAYWRSNMSPAAWAVYWLIWPWRRWRAGRTKQNATAV